MSHDVAGLIAALPGIDWLTDAALVRQRSRDFFWYSPVLKRQLNGARAEAVACPRDEAEVAQVLAECHARRIPVTPRGAGTGNYGQAMPLRGGIVLDLSGMDRVLWLRGGVLRVQAGARLAAIEAETIPRHGLELRFHPSTRRTATIGGFIAGGSAGASGFSVPSGAAPSGLAGASGSGTATGSAGASGSGTATGSSTGGGTSTTGSGTGSAVGVGTGSVFVVEGMGSVEGFGGRAVLVPVVSPFLGARPGFLSLAEALSFLRASPGLALAPGLPALYGLSLRQTSFGSANVPLIITPV